MAMSRKLRSAIAVSRMILTHSSRACRLGSHGYGSASQRFLDDMGDVNPLLLEHRGRVRRHAGLGEAGEELVGETAAHHAMKRPVAAGPVIVERAAIAARDRVDAESAPELLFCTIFVPGEGF